MTRAPVMGPFDVDPGGSVMAWFNGMLALLRTGMPDGLSWEQRKQLNRWIKRRGLGPRLASLQLEKVL